MKFQISNFKFQIFPVGILVCILLLAAFLRLYRISDYMTFLGDEGRDVLVVKDIVEGIPFLFSGDFESAREKLTLLGPTASVGGFFMGPIYYYFMAPFLWLFNFDPVGPAVMVALFGVATVFLIYRIGREFFGVKTALLASLLYAISPLVLVYSRSSWNPNLMPFFSLTIMYILYRATVKNKVQLFFFAGILYGIAIQLHYIELFLGVGIVVYLFLKRLLDFKEKKKFEKLVFLKKILKECLIIFGGFLIGWSPFLAFEVLHDFTNIRNIFQFVFSSGEAGGNIKFFETVYDVFFRLFGRLVTVFPEPKQVAVRAHLEMAIWYWVTLILGIFSFSFFITKIKESYQKNKEQFYKFLLIAVWFIVGVLLFGFYKKEIHDYYFQFIFPLPFIMVSYFLVSLWNGNFLHKQKIKTVGKIISVSIIVWLLYINFSGIPFNSSANKQKEQAKKISDFVLEKTDGKPYNFALLAVGNSDHAYKYFFSTANHEPVIIEYPGKDPNRTSVTDQLFVVCERPPCHPEGHSLWEIAGFGRAKIEEEWDVSVVKVYKLVHYEE